MGNTAPLYDVIEIPTMDGRLERVYADRPRNLSALFERAVSLYGEREALVDGSFRMTFSQLESRIASAASALYYRYGINSGDRVALMLRNGYEFVASVFAVARLGAIAVPLNIGLRGESLAFPVRDCEAATMIADSEFCSLAADAGLATHNLKHIFAVGADAPRGAIPFSDLLVPGRRTIPATTADENEAAVLLYTSGTTGVPKGALLSHKNVIASAMNSSRLCGLMSGRDSMLVVGPLFHITGLAMTLCSSIYAGITAVLVKRFKAADTIALIAGERPTVGFAVPTVLWLMFHAPEFEHADLSSLRFIAAGGAPVPEELLKCCAEKLPGVSLVPGYGLTEASGMTHSTVSLEEASRMPRSVGRPNPLTEARVVDSSGNEVPPGTPGELLVRGSQVMTGYWNNHEETQKSMVDGWLHTGDIAAIDEEGYTYILDRMKDMIIRGGENIYSTELENALYRNPKILEAAIVGVPDPVYGEQVKACLVLKSGESATVEEIRDFCRQYMSSFKIPQYVEFRESLPRNPSGKVLKHLLKKSLTDSQ